MKNTKVHKISIKGQSKYLLNIIFNMTLIAVSLLIYKCLGDGFAMAWRQVKPPEETFACNFDTGICKNWLQAGIGLLISR